MEKGKYPVKHGRPEGLEAPGAMVSPFAAIYFPVFGLK
jgi:hypothetical protein